MKALSALLVLVALFTAPRARAAAEAELLVDGDALVPSTTLELRFAREMIKAEEVGLPATPAPLTVQPALAGTFTWLSKRSGVFTPTAEPAMGATYTVTLRAGLKDAEGKAVSAKLPARLKTPAFGVMSGLRTKDNNLSSPTPTEQLVFNREVKLEGAAALFRFVDAKGQTVGAAVRYAKAGDYYRSEPDEEPWEQRWAEAHGAPKPPPVLDEFGRPKKPEISRNRLIIQPVESLAVGTAWRLEMKPGLHSLTGDYILQRKETSLLGALAPFTIEELTTSSYLNSGRSVELKFSRSASDALQEDTAAQFFKFTPAVGNLHFTQGYNSIQIRGDFQRGVDYRLEFSPELRDQGGVPLGGERVRTLRFGAVKPRVYLPVVDGHQMALGQRKFPVTCVNMKSLRVTAQIVPAGQAAEALRTFREYEQVEHGDERFERVAPAKIAGTKVFDRTTVLPNPHLDQRQELLLDWTELLAGARTGVILLTVDGLPMEGLKTPRAGAQALLQLTDLGVLWKKVGDELRVSVFSMATGQPVPETEVTILTEEPAVYDPDPKAKPRPPKPLGAAGAARTNAEGLATLPVVTNLTWLTIRHGEDTHILRPSTTELPMAAFRLPIQYGWWEPQGPKGDVLRALLFSDRPLYKPGETAHVKGLVRALGKAGLRFVAGAKGTLTVSHPHEGKSDEIAIVTDEHGAFQADIPLDPAQVGGYSVSLKLGDGKQDIDGFMTTFLTADYQPNAFDVTIAMPARFAPGAEVAAKAGGRYFFGAPLGAAHVKWTVQCSDTSFGTNDFGEFTFHDEGLSEAKSFTQRGEGDLAAGGTLDLRPHLPEAKNVPNHGVLTVEVTDQNQQTVTQQQEFTRDASSFYLGMKVTEGDNIGQTESIGAMAIALRPDGTPLPKRVAVKAELIRIFYETVRAQSAGGAQAYHTEKREEVVQSADGQTLVPERAGAEWVLPPGETARFKPGHGGAYLFRISAKDDGGRTVRTQYQFAVSGTEPVAWDYRNPAQVELLADKADYHPGETARLLIKTPIAGEAMVNVERDNQVLRSLRVTLKGNAPLLEIPLVKGDGPNVFVSMILIRGAEQSTRKLKAPEYRYGLCRVHVSEPETALAVKITPRVPKVEPGQEIVTELAVLEANGKPAAGADVTFFAVDDGVLAITGYDRPKPLAIFEKPFPLKIRTGLSLYELIPEISGDLEAIAEGPLMNKGYLIGGGGIEGPGIRLRSDFPGTACWEPALKTDAQGKVTVKFKAPDALTSYRLVAVAHAGTNRFGSAESNVQIGKRLILLSALGQFAHAGDTLTARAVVRNESTAAGTAVVKLELDATAEKPAKPLELSVPLKAGEAQNVDFPIKLKKPGTAQWKWTARMSAAGGQLEDGLLATLKVISPAPILHETYLPDLGAAQNDLLAGVNPQLLEGTGNVQVTLSNTRLASLRESSQALLEYPYGCAEQTVSTMIPWIVSRDFGTIMPALADEKAFEEAIGRAGDKLAAMKTESGGLAYWPGGSTPDLAVSAYAALAMSLIVKHVGREAEMPEELLKYLSESLRTANHLNSRVSPDDIALTLYALANAGKAEPAYHETLFQKRTQLTSEGRALLACAIMDAKLPKVAKLNPAPIEALLDPRAPSPECTCWWGSATRERAIRLLAWTKFRPQDKETTRLTQEVLAARVSGAWRTTQENAWALLALSKYFAAVEGTVKPVSGTLARQAEEKPFALTPEIMTSKAKYDFTAAAGLGKLTVANPQTRPLYGDVRFTVEPPVAIQPRQNRGYGVTRAYYKIGDDGALTEAKDLLVGDRVVVLLKLENQAPGHFVAIDDPLPAIFEAVNPEFKSQQVGGQDAGGQDWHSDYREMRAERVLYFCDHLPAGAHTFRYLARVRSAGRVMAPSTKVEEMYRPERFGLAEGSILESKAR
ncbi:MAG TPA: MG2 domain-containing protein [Chthoniobacteraceae bacterium]|jgi:uncharacterized protein YfaS (alpha-2-macroglobulin family)|nr:MG2 domain-containing protein [Chthoniobacteraceae bacterium]